MLHRRGFLGLAGAAAIASAASKPIRTAVYGVGHAHARAKIRVLRKLPQFELIGVCPRDFPERFDESAGIRRLVREEILEDPSIELVAVEAEVRVNLEYAHEAVEAGKFVHLDKSPGADLDSLRRLFDRADQQHRIVQMGYMWRYHTAMRTAVEMAKSGELGDVYMVRATINKPMSAADRLPLAVFPGGMMFEMGGHMVDRIVDVLGKPNSAWGKMRHDGPFDDGLADNTMAVMEFDHAMAEVYVAALQPNGNSYRTFQILGTKGTATVQPFSPDGHLSLDMGAGLRKLDLEITAPSYETDFLEMAGVIRENKRPLYSAEHDLAVQETLLRVCGML